MSKRGKMKKLLLIFVMMFALAFSVSAWHCADTDQAQPVKINGVFGQWGDDGFLGGTSTGYLNKDVPLPDGCTGTKVLLSRGHFYYKNIVCQDACDGTTLVEYYCDDRPGYNGETVMFWNYYRDSDECGNEVPEFGVVAAGIAMIGALTIFIVRRRH
jgi:hypothetical protein